MSTITDKSVSTIADKLQDLVTAKADIKTALVEKGVEPTGGLNTYADAIRSIESGGFVEGKFENGTVFAGSITIKHIPLFDTSHWTTMTTMFKDCDNLLTVPLFDTGNVTNMEQMFLRCTNLLSVPLFDTGNVTNMASMFAGCRAISDIPLFDTDNVTNMGSTFMSCSNLEVVPLFDTGNVTNMSGTFRECTKLKTIPQFNTNKVVSFSGMFHGCESLETIPELNAAEVSTIGNMFRGCTYLTEFGGLNNFGKKAYLYENNDAFYGCKSLSRESCLNIFNKLYDRATAGYSTVTLQFSPEVTERLTLNEIAIATNKGWIISN